MVFEYDRGDEEKNGFFCDFLGVWKKIKFVVFSLLVSENDF